MSLLLLLRNSPITVEKTVTLDARVKEVRTKTVTLDGIIKEILTKTFTLDGIIKVISAEAPTIDGIIIDYREYSREVIDTLPDDNSILTIAYSDAEIIEVEVDNDTYVSVSSLISLGAYKIHQFKHKHSNNTDTIQIKIQVKTNYAPSSSPVYLQIFNIDSDEWEIIDSDSTTAINTEFELFNTVSENLADYYDDNYWVSVRVYQGMVL